MPVVQEELHAYHASPGALERLLPPWDKTEVTGRTGDLDGGTVTFRVPAGPFRVGWTAVHVSHDPPHGFSDTIEETGLRPFRTWHHDHRFVAAGQNSVLEDDIIYRIAGGPLGLLAAPMIRKRLVRMFSWRHMRTAHDLQRPHATPMKVAITGATGLIGTHLTAYLQTAGHTVIPFVRGNAAGEGIHWDIDAGTVDTEALKGCDAVIHLAGASIADGRWNEERKQTILNSREAGTRLIAQKMAEMEDGPRILVSASAVGYYGTGEDVLDETSPAGDDFLADVCARWEAAAQPAADAGIRVVHPRIGILLSGAGGALAKMLLPFKMGAGGPVGSGKQWFPWVAMDDVLGAFHHALTHDVSGPMNVTSPNPVRQKEFARTLARVLRRPAIAPLPSFAVKAMFGEMGDVLLLQGQCPQPTVLQRTSYTFQHTDLEAALRFELGKMPLLKPEKA